MATQASDSIRQKPRATTADELTVIVQRAQSFTNASGAAIAISEGNTDEIVCRARSGASAPDVGTALRVEGSFTGLCIQSGKELRCDDAETDTRVDTSAIRALGIRSMVVTPIRDEGRVVGVLAVFAPTPHAFTITHVAVLKTMADQISALLQKERRTKDEPRIESPAPAPLPVPVPVAVAVATPKPVLPAVPLPPPVVIKPVVTPSGSTGAAVAPARLHTSSVSAVSAPAPMAASSASKVEAVALAADISTPIAFPRKEERREYKPDLSPVPKTSFGTLDAVAGEPAKSSGGKLMIIGVVAVLAVAGVAGWLYLRAHKSSSSAQAQQQNPAPPATATAPAAATTNPTAASAVTTPPVPVTTAPSTPKTDVSEKTESKKVESRKKEQPQQQDTPPAPTTVSLGSGPSRITQAAPTPQSPDVTPSLAVGAAPSSGLASLARPVNTATPTVMAHSDLVNAKAIRTVPPIYPELAKTRRISGTVDVKVTVGKDGKVQNPRFISGPIIFRDAAFDAVKQWVFRPAELNGQTIEQETDIRLSFHP